MNWTDVKIGDTVTVKTKGVTLTGPVVKWWGTQTDVTQLTVGDITVYPYLSELVEHKPGFKDGDIVVFASPITGTWVGIYDSEERMFYDNSEEDNRTALFSDVISGDITIIGNIKDFRK